MQKVKVTKTYFDKNKDRYFNPEEVFEVEEERANLNDSPKMVYRSTIF